MPVRVNDPQSLEQWIVKTEQRIRELEARRIDAADGLSQDHATKQMSAKISEVDGNAASIGDDGGIYAADTITSAADHVPLFIQKFMLGTPGTFVTATDTQIVWAAEQSSGTWTTSTTEITIPENGFYHVSLTWQWVSNAVGIRALKVVLNAGTVAANSIFSNTMAAHAGTEVAQGISEYRDFVAGDRLSAWAFQNSGGNLNGGAVYFGNIRGRFSVSKVHDSFPPELTTSTDTGTA